MRILVVALTSILGVAYVSALAQAPVGPTSGPPLRPPDQRSVRPVTQGQLAVALAAKLGLGDKLTENRAIGLLAAHGIVPETGWNKTGPAPGLFLVEIQKSIHLLLTDVARNLGIPIPPTLNLTISTPGHMGGQTFIVRPEDVAALRARSTASEADKLRTAETAQAAIETPHPYPIGDDQSPAVWSYRLRVPGARFVKVHFSRLELAAPDYIQVLDRYGQERWRLVGGGPPTTDVWSNAVDDDTAILVMHAGGAGSGWGFKIDRYSYGTLTR